MIILSLPRRQCDEQCEVDDEFGDDEGGTTAVASIAIDAIAHHTEEEGCGERCRYHSEEEGGIEDGWHEEQRWKNEKETDNLLIDGYLGVDELVLRLTLLAGIGEEIDDSGTDILRQRINADDGYGAYLP